MNSNNNNNTHHHLPDAAQNENENHLIGNILAEEDEYNSGKYLALQRCRHDRLNSIFFCQNVYNKILQDPTSRKVSFSQQPLAPVQQLTSATLTMAVVVALVPELAMLGPAG
jgi:hypothetical protein